MTEHAQAHIIEFIDYDFGGIYNVTSRVKEVHVGTKEAAQSRVDELNSQGGYHLDFDEEDEEDEGEWTGSHYTLSTFPLRRD